MKNFLKYFPLKLTIQNLLEINQIHTPMTLKFQTVQDYYILGQQEKVNFRGDPDHHEIPQLCYSISMQLHDRLLPTYGTTKSRGFSLRTEHAKKTTLKKGIILNLGFQIFTLIHFQTKICNISFPNFTALQCRIRLITCLSYVLMISLECLNKMADYLVNWPFCSDDFIRSYEIIRSQNSR